MGAINNLSLYHLPAPSRRPLLLPLGWCLTSLCALITGLTSVHTFTIPCNETASCGMNSYLTDLKSATGNNVVLHYIECQLYECYGRRETRRMRSGRCWDVALAAAVASLGQDDPDFRREGSRCKNIANRNTQH